MEEGGTTAEGGAQGRRRQPRGDARVAEDEPNRDVSALVHWGDRDEGGSFWRVQAPEREVVIPEGLELRAANLGNGSLEYAPASLLTRFAIGWAECLEGGGARNEGWAKLARCRARLLLTWIKPEGNSKRSRLGFSSGNKGESTSSCRG